MGRADRTSAVLLASGLSSRFGAAHKLAAPFHGRPLGLWALDALAASGLDRVRVVVSAHTPQLIVDAAAGAGFEVVFNPRPEEGMGSAIALAFSRPGLGQRAFIALADMPYVAARHYAALGMALQSHPDSTIAVPLHAGRRGHPVLFDERHFSALSRLSGDRGAAALMRDHAVEVIEVQVADPDILLDADTPEALGALERDFPPPTAT